MRNLDNDESREVLKIRNKLPQIIVPSNKQNVFIEWWNKDVRFLNEIPHAFNEGYMILENSILAINLEKSTDFIKNKAKQCNSTYRNIEEQLKKYISDSKKMYIYFEFVDDYLNIKSYTNDYSIYSKMVLKFGKSGEEPLFEQIDEFILNNNEDFENMQNHMNIFISIMIITIFWYMATTTTTTKYHYEKHIQHKSNECEEKDIRKVKHKKEIITPIYDISKIRHINVDKCIQHRKGWTYSHSFQVCGHYRHYKNGKTVFIQPFIKGKGKEFQEQKIIINPN